MFFSKKGTYTKWRVSGHPPDPPLHVFITLTVHIDR